MFEQSIKFLTEALDFYQRQQLDLEDTCRRHREQFECSRQKAFENDTKIKELRREISMLQKAEEHNNLGLSAKSARLEQEAVPFLQNILDN